MADLAALTARMIRHAARDGRRGTALPRPWLIRAQAPTQLPPPSRSMPVLYAPSVCLVVHGRKRALLGPRVHDHGAGRTLVASVDLPIVGSVAEAKAALLPTLPQDLFPGGAKAGWWLKAAQLDLEAKGVVGRGPAAPVRLFRTPQG